MNKNQEQLKTAPEEKTCNTTQTNTKGLNELHHLEEPPTTQSFNTHMYTNDQKQGHCGVKTRNVRSINMRGVNEMQHLGEQYSLHHHDSKFHINDQEPMNSKQNNEQTEFEENSQEQPETNHGDQYLEQLQREGKVCSKNCVLCTILWSCQKKLGFYICGLQLMLLLFLHAAEKIQREDLKCENFMEIFMKCGVTQELEDEEFEWFDDESSKHDKIEKAWKTVNDMDDGVCLLGIKSPNAPGGGHCILSDTGTKDANGTVMFNDPQRGGERRMNKEQFKEYLEDENIVGLKLYTVNLQKLKEIINEYRKILHHTDEKCQSSYAIPIDV